MDYARLVYTTVLTNARLDYPGMDQSGIVKNRLGKANIWTKKALLVVRLYTFTLSNLADTLIQSDLQ